jgi:hypothetical protein
MKNYEMKFQKVLRYSWNLEKTLTSDQLKSKKKFLKLANSVFINTKILEPSVM